MQLIYKNFKFQENQEIQSYQKNKVTRKYQMEYQKTRYKESPEIQVEHRKIMYQKNSEIHKIYQIMRYQEKKDLARLIISFNK